MTTMAEPEWDEETRNLVLGLDAVELCPLCGRPSYICQNQEYQFNWQVPDPVRCHATTALLSAQSRVTEETNPQHLALLWSAVLSDGRRSG